MRVIIGRLGASSTGNFQDFPLGGSAPCGGSPGSSSAPAVTKVPQLSYKWQPAFQKLSPPPDIGAPGLRP